MSSFIELTGSRKEKGKRWRCVYGALQRAVLHGCFEGEILTGQLACLITFVSRCRAEPVTLLIKASLSRVSGSVSLSADCFPHSAARTDSWFYSRRSQETFCLTVRERKIISSLRLSLFCYFLKTTSWKAERGKHQMTHARQQHWWDPTTAQCGYMKF